MPKVKSLQASIVKHLMLSLVLLVGTLYISMFPFAGEFGTVSKERCDDGTVVERWHVRKMW